MNFFTILCESKTCKMDTFSISLFPFEQRKNGKHQQQQQQLQQTDIERKYK